MSQTYTSDPVREVVEALLAEDRQYFLKERRATQRVSLFRPVTIWLGADRQEPLHGFTRDVSHAGLGLVHQFSLEQKRLATIAVHRLWDEPVLLRCQVQWCGPFGRGWSMSGWSLLNVENA
jgi:hypothetical protein